MKQAAETAHQLSSDLFHPTGAVVVKDNIILGRGANQSGLRSKKLQQFHRDYLCLRRLLRVPSGKMYWLCPGCAGFNSHAEARALADALRRNQNIAGADLYLYGHWWCCKSCWDKMIAADIKHVYLQDQAWEKFA